MTVSIWQDYHYRTKGYGLPDHVAGKIVMALSRVGSAAEVELEQLRRRCHGELGIARQAVQAVAGLGSLSLHDILNTPEAINVPVEEQHVATIAAEG